MEGVKKEGQECSHIVLHVLAKEPEAIISYETRLQEAAEGCSASLCHGHQRRSSGSCRIQGLVLRYCAVNKRGSFLKHSVMLSDFSFRFTVLI